MKVKELIKELQELPQDKEILITSMDDDFCCDNFEVHSYIEGVDEEDEAIEIIMGVYIDGYTEEPKSTGVHADKVALAEIDSELFFDEISMDTKSWSYDYEDLEQNTKVFEYIKKYYPNELQALKNKEIDYIEVYYD